MRIRRKETKEVWKNSEETVAIFHAFGPEEYEFPRDGYLCELCETGHLTDGVCSHCGQMTEQGKRSYAVL